MATVMVFFPVGSYDLLRGGTDIVIARDDRLTVDPARFRAARPDGRPTIVRRDRGMAGLSGAMSEQLVPADMAPPRS